ISCFARAIRDHHSRLSQPDCLTFRTGDVIKISKLRPMPDGWLYGAIDNREGHVPVDHVRIISQQELCKKHDKTSPLTSSDPLKSSSLGSLSGSRTFSEMITSASMDINNESRPTHRDMSPVCTLPGTYSMMEYALQNFKIPHRRKGKKSWKNSEWTWNDYSDLIKWSKTPIHAPLLRQTSTIMRFMDDHSMGNGQSEIDCIYYLLKNMYKDRDLLDEIYSQLLKQLTNNKSSKADSLKRGWSLLSVVTNYFIPNEALRPYVLKYINDNITNSNKEAQTCLKHYNQTIKYGGRKNVPSKSEIDATSNGRNSKRQTLLLPGGLPITIQTQPSMVIGDCISQVCDRLNITNLLEQDEYSIYVISSEHTSRLLNPTEYILDILSECLRTNIGEYHFIVKRLLWYFLPLKFDNELFINSMYNQIMPDYLDGTMIIVQKHEFTDERVQEISLLAALHHYTSKKVALPSMREVKYLLPTALLALKSVRPQDWTSYVHQKFKTIESLSILEAKIKVLTILQTWPLFGTTFYTVQYIDHLSVSSPCLIGISKNGLLFLDKETHESLFSIPFNDIISIRRHQNTVDIKYGSLTQPNLIQCQIDKAQDMVALTGRYLSLIAQNRPERKNDHKTYNDPINPNLCKAFVIKLNAIERAIRGTYVIDKCTPLLYEEGGNSLDEGEEEDEEMNPDNDQLT
ncbi:unnamed protein product, partial [Didymodactylos carnosus]